MELDRKTAPGPLEPAPFNIPPAFRVTLPNGLRVVIFDNERLPLVSYRLAFLTGGAEDPPDQTGVSSAMATMLTEGTDNYSSKELAEKIERLGSSLSANSSDDFTVIAGSALSVYSSDILQLMAEVVFAPTFPQNELDLYKRNAMENLKFQRSQPNFLANEQTARVLFGKHPYGTIAPAPADIEKLDADTLRATRERIFLPNNAVLIAVGDVRKDELMREIEEHFGDWEPGNRHEHHFDQPPSMENRRMTIVDRPGSAQANIIISNLAVPRSHPDYFPLLVMNQVLGAGASSRVFMNLREEKGYTYGAYTRFDLKRLAGTFEATTEVRTAVTGDSLKEFFYEFDRIRQEAVLEEELDDAKNFLTGVFPIRAETQEGLTNLIVNQELYGLPHDYLDTYRDHIDAVSVDDVLRVAAEYIRPDGASVVIVGDAAGMLSQIEGYADDIKIFDKDGREMAIETFQTDTDAAPADLAGEWELSLDFQGQQVPITMKLEQDGDKVNGTLTTMLGEGTISEGAVAGNRITAAAVTEIQGQSVEFAIAGSVNGDEISGTISTAIIPDSLEFSGSRKQSVS